MSRLDDLTRSLGQETQLMVLYMKALRNFDAVGNRVGADITRDNIATTRSNIQSLQSQIETLQLEKAYG